MTLLNTATNKFEGKYAAIPERVRGGIMRWVEEGVMPGQFLWAVIRNDLREAVWAADDENLPLIPLYVRWFYWHAPAACCGSVEKANQWRGLQAKNADQPA